MWMSRLAALMERDNGGAGAEGQPPEQAFPRLLRSLRRAGAAIKIPVDESGFQPISSMAEMNTDAAVSRNVERCHGAGDRAGARAFGALTALASLSRTAPRFASDRASVRSLRW